MDITKPLPIITPESTPFWEGCRNGQLLLQRCTNCQTLRYPPAPICIRCSGLEAEWIPSSGKGRIYSFVIYHRAFHPAYTDEVPYAVALVELDEGIRMLLQVVDYPSAKLAIDQEGEVRFQTVTEVVSLPVFVPES